MPAQYAYYEFVRDLPELTAATNQLEIRLRRDGHKLAADVLLKAYAALIKDLERVSVVVAAAATELLKESERKTRVRPDSQGLGGPRLETSLIAEPVEIAVLPGSVGVANETKLDREVPWWSTNEEGSSARVGGRIFGTFGGAGGAGAPPDASQFRQHPVFEPGRGPNAGLGIIQRPIPARRFILKAIPEIDKVWHHEFRAARTRFDNELSRVQSMAAVPARRVR